MRKEINDFIEMNVTSDGSPAAEDTETLLVLCRRLKTSEFDQLKNAALYEEFVISRQFDFEESAHDLMKSADMVFEMLDRLVSRKSP